MSTTLVIRVPLVEADDWPVEAIVAAADQAVDTDELATMLELGGLEVGEDVRASFAVERT